jgi:3-keto-L-gulonate-6-phosphate decarboxylase
VRQRAWEKTAEVGSMAMTNIYVATAVTKVSEGVEAANTIYAQTMELVQEKRRGLMDAFSSTTTSSSASTPSDVHNSLVVAVHTNADDLHAEQQQQQQLAQDPFVEPHQATLDIQVNPDY